MYTLLTIDIYLYLKHYTYILHTLSYTHSHRRQEMAVVKHVLVCFKPPLCMQCVLKPLHLCDSHLLNPPYVTHTY
jgi:hypothetical protein